MVRSSNLVELNRDVCFYLPGPHRLKTAPVLAFPTVVVCCDCGLMQSHLSAADLRLLREDAAQIERIAIEETTFAANRCRLTRR